MFRVKKSLAEPIMPYRRRPGRRPCLAVWLAAAGGFAVVVGAVYLVIFSGYARVKNIIVVGAKQTIPSEVKHAVVEERAKSAVWRSWVGPERMLFWIGSRGAAALPAVPAIRTRTIKIDLKKKTVRIVVDERVTWGIWCRMVGGCVAIDREGIVLGDAPRGDGYLIPLMITESETPPVPNQSVMTNSAQWKMTLSALQAVAESGHVPSRAIFRAAAAEEWQVETVRGPSVEGRMTIMFSSRFIPDRLEEIIQTVIDRASGPVRVIDFRVPDKVYYR